MFRLFKLDIMNSPILNEAATRDSDLVWSF